MKILLVDDEVELVSALAERLSLRGMDAQWASNGDDAMGIAKQGGINVAVLDMKMPGLSGLELRRMLHEEDAGIQFIFLSGHGSAEDFEAGSAEAASYLVKPVRIEDLIEKIKAAYEKGRA